MSDINKQMSDWHKEGAGTLALLQRQPTQIALYQDNSTLVALCNDGSIWSFGLGLVSAEWQQLPAIPQPERPTYSLEEPIYPEPDERTCPVRCLGTVECAETGKVKDYLFRDAVGNKTHLTSQQLDCRQILLNLFGGSDAWLKKSFPEKATITKSVGGIRFPEEAVVDFCISAAAAHLKERCRLVESITGSLKTISEARGISGKQKFEEP
ncbi:hypothetical protein [Acetobacter orientalis]|uniref:hypothetical protein n=1 Tax=Acetobacter orientalis TaxID=146474 RepID=UPI0039EBFA2A